MFECFLSVNFNGNFWAFQTFSKFGFHIRSKAVTVKPSLVANGSVGMVVPCGIMIVSLVSL